MKNIPLIILLLVCVPAGIFAQHDTSHSRKPVIGVKAVAGLNMALPGQTLAPSAQGALFLDAVFRPNWSLGLELRNGVKTYNRRVDGNWSYDYSERLYSYETPIVLKHTFDSKGKKLFTLGGGVGLGSGGVDMSVKKAHSTDPYEVWLGRKQDGILLSVKCHYWIAMAYRDFTIGKKLRCFAGLEYQQLFRSRKSYVYIVKPVGNSYEEIRTSNLTVQYRMVNVVVGFYF